MELGLRVRVGVRYDRFSRTEVSGNRTRLRVRVTIRVKVRVRVRVGVRVGVRLNRR